MVQTQGNRNVRTLQKEITEHASELRAESAWSLTWLPLSLFTANISTLTNETEQQHAALCGLFFQMNTECILQIIYLPQIIKIGKPFAE